MSERGQSLTHVLEEVRNEGVQSTREEAGVRWETKEREEHMDTGTDGFLHMVEKQVEDLFVAPVFLLN